MNLEKNTTTATLISVLLVAVGCQPSIQEVPQLLEAWTTELRDTQPDDAYAAVYKIRDSNLIFVAAKHSTRTDSLTFKVIRDAYSAFDLDVVIVEGFPNSRGPNPERLIEWVAAKHEVDGFQEGGEAVPAVRGALEEGATLWGGEPDDSGIRDRVLAQGFSQEDLLGFYTLRSVPQWIRERKIESAHDPDVRSLIDGELENNRSRLGFPQSVLTSYDDWANWYADTNNKSFGTSFDAEETGPLANGPHGSNKVAAAISRARAAFLHSLIVEHLNMGETMMVVFGASHLLIHRPALDHALGVPCYVGVALDEARDDCID